MIGYKLVEVNTKSSNDTFTLHASHAHMRSYLWPRTYVFVSLHIVMLYACWFVRNVHILVSSHADSNGFRVTMHMCRSARGTQHHVHSIFIVGLVCLNLKRSSQCGRIPAAGKIVQGRCASSMRTLEAACPYDQGSHCPHRTHGP